MNRKIKRTFELSSILALLAVPSLCLASPYGAGNYSSGTYNNSITIGPVTLPTTGPALTAYAGIVLLSISAGIVVWLRQRRTAQS